MKRRDVLAGAGTLLIAALAKAAPTATAKTTGEHHHDAGASPLTDAAADCLKKGEACEEHCFALLGSGDTTMVGCATAVRDMLASVRGLLTLAAANSKHTKLLAQACATICKDCEAECRKHADKHQPCKDCGDACARMQAEIAKL
jgi:Cys-rich four helix bundle protein (predicted Tat secretion target)